MTVELSTTSKIFSRTPAAPSLSELTLTKNGLLMLEKELKPVPNWMECALVSVNACRAMNSMVSHYDGAEENTCMPEEHERDLSNPSHE